MKKYILLTQQNTLFKINYTIFIDFVVFNGFNNYRYGKKNQLQRI